MMYRKLFTILALLAGLTAFGCEPQCINPDLEALKPMLQAELDQTFTNATAGPIPNGKASGVALNGTGRPVSMMQSAMWKGKTLNCPDPAGPCTLKNRLMGGQEAIPAEVYYGTSPFDGKESIIFDYSNTPGSQNIMDEVRQVGDQLYLGRMYTKNARGQFALTTNFTLDFKCPNN